MGTIIGDIYNFKAFSLKSVHDAAQVYFLELGTFRYGHQLANRIEYCFLLDFAES